MGGGAGGSAPCLLLRAQEDRLITEFAPAVTSELRKLRNFPNLTVLDVTRFDLEVMNQAMVDFAIRPRDALHFAAMQSISCLDLASNDHHFDRIPQIRRFS